MVYKIIFKVTITVTDIKIILKITINVSIILN